MRVQDLGLRGGVEGFTDLSLGCRVEGVGLGVWGVGRRVEDVGLTVWISGCRD